MKRNGMLVLVGKVGPRFPSWRCRLLGHRFWQTQEHQGTLLLRRQLRCERCGAYEEWEHIDSLSEEDLVEAETL